MPANTAIRSQAKAAHGMSFPPVISIKKLAVILFYSLPLLAFLARGAEPAILDVQGRPSNDAPLKVPLRVIVHKVRRNAAMGLVSLQATTSGGAFRSSSEVRAEIQAYIQAQAREYGVNPNLAVWIVKHESQFNPRAKGDGEASRGLWQISKIYHPEVPDAVAFNVKSSTEWSLERIAAGKVNEWSTYRFCKTLYSDCPY
jgi:hypothetical protein